jgi:hypothetical protein
MTEKTTSSGRGGFDPTLMPLITSFMAARVVHVAAELGITDLLASGAKSTEMLASETGANIPALHRQLRALASLGLIDELEPGRFALNAPGEQLRTGAPGSVRNLALVEGSERAWRSWGELRHSILTGTPAFRHVFGVDLFEYLARDPKQAAVFNEAMAEITRQVAKAVVMAYNFATFSKIVDVGGGNGTLIAAILDTAPKLRGIVFDSSSGSAEASDQLRARGVLERCEVAILKNCRDAIVADGKLLLIERVMPARIDTSADHQRWTMRDMHMLVMVGGRERTEEEFRSVLAAANFELRRTLLLPGATGFSVIEATPI